MNPDQPAPAPSSPTPPAPAPTPAQRTQVATVCAAGLALCFFLPWLQLFGAKVSGWELQRYGDTAKFFWLSPILGGLTLFAGITGRSQQIAGQLAGASPFAILAYGLSQMGRELFDVLAPGAWLGLILGVILFLAARR